MNLPCTISINRCEGDIEFLVSHWSTESHTFIVALGEFGPTLKDVSGLTMLPLFGDVHVTGVVDEDRKKLDFLK